jgi:hypothetical protein
VGSTTTLVVRDDSSNTIAFVVVQKDNPKIDSVIRDGTSCSEWRNKVASVTNPLTKGEMTYNVLGLRPPSSYYTGTLGILLLSTTAISTVNRALIEDYYITKFGIS